MKVILFAGFHRSRKTKAIAKITRELTKRGKKVGIVKSALSKELIGYPRKDSYLHYRAGAERVLLVTRSSLIAIDRCGDELKIPTVIRYFDSRRFDYILVEGLYSIFSDKAKTVLCTYDASDIGELLRLHHNPSFGIKQKGRGEVREGLFLLNLRHDTQKIIDMIL